MKSKKPRIVIVSGSSSGIGKELCALYRAAGDTVIGMSRRGGDNGDIAVDVTDYAAVENAVNEIAMRYGGIDTVIANAGGGLSGATELLPLDEVQAQMSLNFTGALNLVRCALKHMQAGGRAVFVSSACALFALPYRAIYCASKAAVNMAAFGLYMELKKHGIKVTSVCAGDIKTNFTANRVKYAEGGERYGDAPRISAQKIDSREHKRMRLQPAAKKIYKCCNKCKKPMYIIGFKYKVLNFLRHILPQKLFLDITAKLF